MKIPLLCDVGSDALEIVRNGKVELRPLPFRPHIIVPARQSGPHTILRQRIGSREMVELEKVEYHTVEEMEKSYISTEMHKLHYIEQIYTERKDYFLEFPNDCPLKILVLDIEVLTDGSGIFPRASSSPIVAVGMKIVGGDEYIYTTTAEELDGELKDWRILMDMVDTILDLDPDIIATYNGVKFDLPYLIERMTMGGINPSLICRGNEEITPEDIHHRIHWDMWRDVDGDQTLLGLPNRRLKTVGHHFGWTDIIDLGREALSNTSTLVGTPLLSEYLSSDLRLTESLTSVYLSNHIALGEMMGIPLREMIHSYNSLIPKMQHIRALKGQYIGLRSNTGRYIDKTGTMKYEAARVAAYVDGAEVDTIQRYYPRVWKVDFASQYPSAMITFNLGPDTTQIMELRSYTGKYEFHRSENALWLNLPDRNMMKQVIIRVMQDKDGFLRERLSVINAEREVIKELMVNDPDNRELYSRGWGYKVEANTIYGYEGLTSSKWGDLGTAIATVGLCRWLIMATEEWIGDIKIETDSVLGTTALYILRSGNKELQLIQDLIPYQLVGQNNIRYTLPSNIMVETRNGWKRALYIKQHLVTKDIYRVSTADDHVDITCDHSLFRDNGMEIKPTELVIGDTIDIVGSRSNIITSIQLTSRETENWVYDISTDDGTFVTLGGIILHNTDGIFSSAAVNVDLINSQISTLIEDTFGVPCQMSVELEEYGRGYFYKTKNYILEEDGALTRHGTAFKSSRHSRVYEKAMEILCTAVLDQVEDMWPIIREVKDWSQYSIPDFIHHTSFNQDPQEYSNPNTIQPRLAREARRKLGVTLGKGDSIDYIVTTGRQYTIASEVTTIDQIDIEYYEGDLNKILSILGLGREGLKGEYIIYSAQPLLI